MRRGGRVQERTGTRATRDGVGSEAGVTAGATACARVCTRVGRAGQHGRVEGGATTEPMAAAPPGAARGRLTLDAELHVREEGAARHVVLGRGAARARRWVHPVGVGLAHALRHSAADRAEGEQGDRHSGLSDADHGVRAPWEGVWKPAGDVRPRGGAQCRSSKARRGSTPWQANRRKRRHVDTMVGCKRLITRGRCAVASHGGAGWARRPSSVGTAVFCSVHDGRAQLTRGRRPRRSTTACTAVPAGSHG